MSALASQLQRLFQPASRAAMLDFPYSSDWPHVARLLDALGDELDVPLPALSLQGKAGFRLWFSLPATVTPEEGSAFVQALCRSYLASLPVTRVRIELPEEGRLAFPPQRDEASGGWTAFIDPEMGGMFVGETWLDIAPSDGAQAERLSRVHSMRPEEFREALTRLAVSPAPVPDASVPDMALAVSAVPASATRYSDPVAYLVSVMNDPSADPALRVEAAKALLPYSAKPVRGD